ncbi:M24 family metallopeptidase [Sulfobacillus thermosulfidooxidans]|uniref:M24 family metallopeptidase n=1 Tax=Sulfobacillus thermosulfidooxidans TaxID=28034 RepID=UPI0002E6530A|nr:M24 family metallopeptidase [Sulfobacillus thermosulfidooxidans]
MHRLAKAKERLGKENAVMFLSPGDDFRYLLSWSPLGDERLTFLGVSGDEVALVIASVNAQEAREHVGAAISVYAFTDQEGPGATLQKVFGEIASRAQTIYISDDARFDHVEQLRHALQLQKPLLTASQLMAPWRMAKDPDEIEKLKACQAINDQAMLAGLAAIRVGMTEMELQDIIRRAFMANGADRDAFIIVAAGSHSALPHHTPDQTVIAEGPVLLDIGCFKDGYASDMTRVAYVGTPSEDFVHVHRIVNQAVEAGIAKARAFAEAQSIDHAARRVIEDAGYGTYFVHRLGHGIGLSVHEPPSIMAGNPIKVPLYSAFSIEPGIYLPKRFGVRLEEVVIAYPDHAEVLSAVPRDIYQVKR